MEGLLQTLIFLGDVVSAIVELIGYFTRSKRASPDADRE